MIEADRLTRHFGDVVAVRDATFEVREGDVYGFLGPNGAGKTTTMRMITGLIEPTRGTARVAGHDVRREPMRAKAAIGYMPEEPSFYGHMTGQDLIAYYGQLHGMPGAEARRRAGELMETVGLGDARDRKVEGYSHGMQKRAALAQALIHDPPILILDEPTGGLDPAGTKWFRDLIRDLHDEGVTIFLSSHVLHEVQQVCTRVGIIHDGEIIADDTPEALEEQLRAGRRRVRVTVDGSVDRAAGIVRDLDGVIEAVPGDGRLVVTLDETAETATVNRALVEAGVDVHGFEAEEADLEEIFLELTGEGSP